MYSLRRRINDSSWMQRNYWDNIISIQNMMYRLKHDQVGWQDNTEVLATFWNNFQALYHNLLTLFRHRFLDAFLDAIF